MASFKSIKGREVSVAGGRGGGGGGVHPGLMRVGAIVGGQRLGGSLAARDPYGLNNVQGLGLGGSTSKNRPSQHECPKQFVNR